MSERQKQTLREALVQSFDEGGLRALAHDLGFHYDALPVASQSTSNKALALIEACRQHGRMPDLLQRCEALRPNVNWRAKKWSSPIAAETVPAAPTGKRRNWLPLVGVVVIVAVTAVAVVAFQLGRGNGADPTVPPTEIVDGAKADAAALATDLPDPTAVAVATVPPAPTAAATRRDAVPATESSSAGAPLPTFTPEPDLPEAINLTDNPGKSDWPVLGLDAAGQLNLIWTDNSLDVGQFDIFQRQMGDDGRWSDPTMLTGHMEMLIDSQGMLRQHPDGRLCMFLRGARVSTNPRTMGLYQTCEQDGQLPGAQQLETADGGSGRDYQPVIQPDGQVQSGYIVGAGTYFFEEAELTDPAWYASDVVTVVDGNGRYHTFMVRVQSTYSLVHRASDDDGQTWSDLTVLYEADSGTVGALRAAGMPDGVHILFSHNGCVYDVNWTEATGWSDPTDITAGLCDNHAVAIGLALDGEGRAHVVWHGRGTIWFTRQTADGGWTPPHAIAEAFGSSPGPAIVVDASGTRHIAWADSGGNRDIFYAALPPD